MAKNLNARHPDFFGKTYSHPFRLFPVHRRPWTDLRVPNLEMDCRVNEKFAQTKNELTMQEQGVMGFCILH